jgi:hypothetical protein
LLWTEQREWTPGGTVRAPSLIDGTLSHAINSRCEQAHQPPLVSSHVWSVVCLKLKEVPDDNYPLSATLISPFVADAPLNKQLLALAHKPHRQTGADGRRRTTSNPSHRLSFRSVSAYVQDERWSVEEWLW